MNVCYTAVFGLLGTLSYGNIKGGVLVLPPSQNKLYLIINYNSPSIYIRLRQYCFQRRFIKNNIEFK